MSLPSKREFLAANINPSTGKPFALAGPGVRGRFSAEAEAFAAENKDRWAEPVKVVKAPKVKAPKPAATPAVPAQTVVQTGQVDPKEVRAWARNVGKQVGERGRIHSSIVAEYLAANGSATRPQVKRPTPLDMPKRRPETSGYSVVGGTLIRQDSCGKCSARVNRCACDTGPRARGFIEKEAGGPVILTLDKPSL